MRRVAVVLALVGEGPPFEASLGGFLREVEGRGEVVLVEGPGRRTPHPNPPPQGGRELSGSLPPCGGGLGWGVAREAPTLRIIPSTALLVPELWGDGLRRVDAELVAFSTTQMIPSPGWLDAMARRLEESGAWGVGGGIAPGLGLGPVDRAIYLHRFLPYAPGAPLPGRPSGENALYRRDRLSGDDWPEGFWEAEVHRRLEGSGATWSQAPEGIVTYAGASRLLAVAGQRVAHARRFGSVRSAGLGRPGRWLRTVAAPAVPAVLLARAARGLSRRGLARRPWLAALPSFLAIAAAWAAGEAIGTQAGH